MTKYLVTLIPEEMAKVRINSDYRSKTTEDLQEAFDRINAVSTGKKSTYAATIEYQGTLDELADDLKQQGFGPDRIRIGPHATLKVPDTESDILNWFVKREFNK